MSEKDNHVDMLAVAVLVGFCLGAGLANHCNHHRGTGKADTVRVAVDTLRDTMPTAKDSVVVGTMRVPMTGRVGGEMGFIGSMGNVGKADGVGSMDEGADDTAATAPDAWSGGKIGGSDTVWTTVPRTQKRYEDSTYTAWVSGYEPRLDSIEVYRRTVFVVKNEGGRVKTRRLTLGLTGGFGYGVFTRKPDLFVGVGATWRPW